MTDREENWDIEKLRRFGKWSQAGVPHKDWRCVGEFDAKEEFGDLVTCEMCEKQQIRFVHLMEHPHYGATLNCGCVCASHMSGDSQNAEAREKKMRSRASRRFNFPNRKGWKVSAKGNPYIKTDGVYLVIAENRDGFYRIGYKNVWQRDLSWSKEGWSTVHEAELAGFSIYEELRAL
ncbi:hypothetical protein EKJ_20680 [Qipengyuania flava]|uniref:Uncharacterized protein n=1 Tax=Qipengyuania flava TaxID=192812 RepID=A0A3T1CJR0_9SPHN|nr:hypothetical protein [Qipengyuania flava]BBI21221.1 hypothetical protein EKJ_20680 [Qipengyuania flava]